MSDEAVERTRRWLKELHARAGYQSMVTHAEGLRQRGARPEVVRMAIEYHCEAVRSTACCRRGRA